MKIRDRVLVFGFRLSASVAVMAVGAIVAVLASQALPAVKAIGIVRFFSDPSWHPTVGMFDIAPMLVGTVLVASGGLALATLLGVASALFCCFFAGKLERPFQRVMELMAGIPSVVYGFWGLVFLVPTIDRIEHPGASLLAGTIILAIMVLPTIALLSVSSLRATPPEYIVGAEALGFSRWTTATRIALPAARRGVAAAIMIGAGRAIGETMAVMMVTGNIVKMPTSVFDPIRTLSANIALEIGYAKDLHRSALFVSALILAIVVMLLTVVSASIGKKSDE